MNQLVLIIMSLLLKLFFSGPNQVLRVEAEEEGRADQAARGPQDRTWKPQGN